jgi:hypothetical protein
VLSVLAGTKCDVDDVELMMVRMYSVSKKEKVDNKILSESAECSQLFEYVGR